MASHDASTEAHVIASINNGVAIAEFPTTVEAAAASYAADIAVLMGTQCLARRFALRNVAAEELLRECVLDMLSPITFLPVC